MLNEASAELSVLILVHFGEIEAVIEELLADLIPETRFSRSQNFSDVGSVSSVVADQISVKFSRYGSGETPIKEQRVEDSHSHKVKS